MKIRVGDLPLDVLDALTERGHDLDAEIEAPEAFSEYIAWEIGDKSRGYEFWGVAVDLMALQVGRI